MDNGPPDSSLAEGEGVEPKSTDSLEKDGAIPTSKDAHDIERPLTCKCEATNGYTAGQQRRNLVVCIDGTSNQFSDKVRGLSEGLEKFIHVSYMSCH